jgi:L-ascorbate metabolism protein UlaG (beta-lactamase superfamily)
MGRKKKIMLRIRWHGHSCWEIKNVITLVTDPHDGKSIGIPAPNVQGDIILVSHDHYDHNSVKTVEKTGCKVITDGRKRSIDDVEINGVESFHDEDQGAKRGNNIMYKFTMDGIKFCHLGDLGHDLDDEAVEKIGEVDVLFIPIGGTFTVDDKQAWDVIKKIRPRIVVPMHYKIGGLSLSISGIDDFLKQNPYNLLHVGNEIDIEKEDLPSEPEVWTFTL